MWYICIVVSGDYECSDGFSKNYVEGGWKWGEHKLPKVSSYSIDFASNGAWDVHLKKVLDNGRNQLHSVIGNRDINLSARRLL